MSIERTYHCDGPDCERNWSQSAYLALEMPTVTHAGPHALHFCGWDCLLRYAATKEPETVIGGDDG
jgi:hypothetical protein